MDFTDAFGGFWCLIFLLFGVVLELMVWCLLVSCVVLLVVFSVVVSVWLFDLGFGFVFGIWLVVSLVVFFVGCVLCLRVVTEFGLFGYFGGVLLSYLFVVGLILICCFVGLGCLLLELIDWSWFVVIVFILV